MARHVRLPSIVLLLATGVALGPDGVGVVDPRSLGDGLFSLVSLAVAIILFEGGLNLDLRRLRREQSSIRRLVTVGALITALGGGIAAEYYMGWPRGIALLFGTLVIVTGPTVIRPLLRYVPLRPRLATVLEAEGLLIDPVGAIVAAVTLQVVTAPSIDSFATGLFGLAARIGFGMGAGLAIGILLVALLRLPRAVPEGLENLVALGGALVGFELCENVLTESGILAVTVAGVVVGNMESRVARALGEFQEHLTIGLIGILFVLLAADVRLANVMGLGMPGLATVAALAVAVRPLNVLVSTFGSELSWREKAFLAWVAPRGVVAAAIASLATAFLQEIGVPEAAEVRALVFLTIALTVVLQGGSAPLVARILGVRAPGRESIVILGAEELAFTLADVLRRTRDRIVFADSNPAHCHAAQQRGFTVVYGNALAQRTLARMRLEQARAALGLTTNNQVNSHFASEAQDAFDVPQTYVAVGRADSDVTSRVVEKQDSRVLFDGPKDVERWNVRIRHGSVHVETFRFVRRDAGEGPREEPAAPLEEETSSAPRERQEPDPYVMLAVRRGEGPWEPMHARFALRTGDRVAVALYQPEESEAARALEALGFEPDEEPPAEVG